MTPQLEQKKRKIEAQKEKFQRAYKDSQFKYNFYNWIQNSTWGIPLSISECIRAGLTEEQAQEKAQQKIKNDKIVRNYFIYSLNQNAPFSNEFLCQVHCCLYNRVFYCAGMYREDPVRLNNVAIDVPPARMVFSYMSYMENKYERSQKNVLDILRLNYDIVTTQPFIDGNKAIAKTITNYELLNQGYSPLLFSSSTDKEKYISAVEKSYQEQNLDTFYDFMLTKMNTTFKDAMLVLQGKEPNQPQQAPTTVASHSSTDSAAITPQKQKE